MNITYKDYKCNPHSVRVDDHGGVISVGWYRDNNNYSFAFNFCSPKDDFDKKLSRVILNGRLNKKDNYYIEINNCGILTPDERNELIISILTKDYDKNSLFNIPNWATHVINQEMVTFIVPKTLLNFREVEFGFDFEVPIWSMIKK